jgi:hypothetical protein
MDAFRMGLSLAFILGANLVLLPLTQADQSSCQSGMVKVDHQCINVGNKASFQFLSVDSVNRNFAFIPNGGVTTIEINGRGYTSHLGGSVSSPIPLQLKFAIKDESSVRTEKPLAQMGFCYQSAALSMSAKDKYLFQVEMSSINTSLPGSAVSGGDGQFMIQLDSISAPHQSYSVQCGNALKS